jgi:lysophospholipase L1-like esterase
MNCSLPQAELPNCFVQPGAGGDHLVDRHTRQWLGQLRLVVAVDGVVAVRRFNAADEVEQQRRSCRNVLVHGLSFLDDGWQMVGRDGSGAECQTKSRVKTWWCLPRHGQSTAPASERRSLRRAARSKPYDNGVLKLVDGQWEVLESGDLNEADVIRNALAAAVQPSIRASIFILVVGIAFGAVMGLKAHNRISSYLHPPGPSAEQLNRIELLSRFPPQGTIAFVGDSQIERADWNALLGRKDIANYGVSGDDTESLLKRLDAVERSGARTAVILIGVNDLVLGRDPDAVAANISKIVARLAKSMRVILVSAMPTSKEHAYLNGPISDLDARLAALCADPCTYVDLRKSLGLSLSTHFTDEGLHLNADGYAAIAVPISRAW